MALTERCGNCAAAGFVRVYLTSSDPLAAVAISCSLFMIVITSVIAGSLLPFGFARAGVDPANAGTSIQVCRAHIHTTLHDIAG